MERRLVSLDKREYIAGGKLSGYRFDRGSVGTLVDYVQEVPKQAFFRSLASTDLSQSLRIAPALHTLGSFRVLPIELIHLVANCIDDLVSLACLAITCQQMWELHINILNTRVHEINQSRSWRGDRLMCIGDGLSTPYSDSLPQGVFIRQEKDTTPSERDAEDELPTVNIHSIYTPAPDKQLSTFMSDFSRIFRRDHRTIRPSPTYRNLHLSLIDFERMYEDSLGLPPPGLRVARNLSKRAYIREASIDDLNTRYANRIPQGHAFNLGHALLMRICWGDPYVDRKHEHDNALCQWAGDRFDIVFEADFRARRVGNGDDWVDASKEVIEDLEKFWLAEEAAKALTVISLPPDRILNPKRHY